MIRVLNIMDGLGIGGIENFVMNYYKKMNSSSVHSDFLIFNSKLDYYEEVIAYKSEVYISPYSKKTGIVKYIFEMYFVYMILKKHNYDVIHCHSCSITGLFRGVIPSKIYGKVKIIAHSHNPGMPQNNIVDKLFRLCARFLLSSIIDFGFACSNLSGESKFTKTFMKSPRYQVISNAVDVNKFKYNELVRNEIRKKYDICDKYVIGSIGRIEPQKNYIYFVDVLKKYFEKDSNAVFLIIGDGSQRKEFEKKAFEEGISNKIIMIGTVLEPEIYYQAMDVFVLPSIYEGFGYVNIEAQISGLACIVSDVVPHEVDISGNVFFEKLSEDFSQWSELLGYVKKMNEKRTRDSILTEKYDINIECIKLENLYNELVYG